VKAPEDEIMVSIGYEPPYEGEVDLQLHVGCTQEVSPSELFLNIESILHSALAFVASREDSREKSTFSTRTSLCL